MLLLLSSLWPGLLAALVLGIGVGWIAGPPAGAAIPLGLGLATLALAGVSAAGLATGVPGLWVDSAAATLAPYLAGCAVAARARRGWRTRASDPPAT